MSVRLYVGNLPKEEIDRQNFQDLFTDAGEGVTTKLIKDRKTGKCRGFAFVTVPTDEVADAFIEKYNGLSFMESEMKIEKALPRTKEGGEDGEVAEGAEQPQPVKTERPTVAVIPRGEVAKKRSKGNNKKRGDRAPRTTTTSYGGAEGFQPDPRWADQLSILKERLAAQTTNP
jgi:RNA recognition motif-containing protein